ncbi:origin recognition complex subunit 6 [Myripristis murdjan]|uniref:Origin recognition complex subunit 6 n=1 Tax=Myripristis murdjan TaxID=586833 RepID=A0A667Y6U9_9TELE|nr:origin recognition complex subunit 6 [Myripristis murdjan]
MENEMFSKLASKMGISSARIIRQAEEYVRLSEVRCATLGNITATGKTVMCLEMAATSMKHPLDKEYVIKLSGLNKKQYQSSLKAMECLLGLESRLGLRELAVQYGCMDAVKVAAQILERYEQSLPAAQQHDLDLSKPLFTTAALYSACKCMKIKVDKKLTASSGAKKSIFDRLVVQLQKLGQDICKEASPLKEAAKTAQKRQQTLLENLEQVEEDECAPSSIKQQREEEEENATAQDYEEWKRKILENALKSTKAEA